MATYLLTWNPKHWHWTDLAACADEVAERGHHDDRWSCGHTKSIRAGDRFFLLRQGVEPRGILGSGAVTKASYQDAHWDRTPSKTAWYVQVRFDTLQDPETDPILPRSALDAGLFAGVHWNTQSSGISIPEPVASELERAWSEVTGPATGAGVVAEQMPLYEGTPRAVTLNVYERNREARRRCLAHYGVRCAVCGFDFGAAYGADGANCIHVHHLRPVSQLGEQYEVDPVRDLRPVCPNCHAVIHRRSPPYSLEDVAAMLNPAD